MTMTTVRGGIIDFDVALPRGRMTVQQMHDWFVRNADNIAYAAYFDVDGLWPTQIDNNRFPKSQLLFRKLFRRSAFLN